MKRPHEETWVLHLAAGPCADCGMGMNGNRHGYGCEIEAALREADALDATAVEA